MDAIGSVANAVGGALGITKSGKAKLKCVPPNVPDSGPAEIECMFNPTEYRLTQTTSVSRNTSATTAGGTPQYLGTDHMTLSLQLFFDDFASLQGDVTPKIDTLLSWTKPVVNAQSADRHPPEVRFVWGGNKQLDSFSGFITSVAVNYTLFRKDGTPVQARVDLTIQGQDEQFGGTNPTSHAIDARRVREVREGDTLHSIAFQELRKPAYWRAIAELNGIDDPMRVTTGERLIVPLAADAAKSS